MDLRIHGLPGVLLTENQGVGEVRGGREKKKIKRRGKKKVCEYIVGCVWGAEARRNRGVGTTLHSLLVSHSPCGRRKKKGRKKTSKKKNRLTTREGIGRGRTKTSMM